MLKLSSHTRIGDYEYKGLANLSVESSSETLTDTLTATFPRKVEYEGKNIKGLIKRNDLIIANIGYNDELVGVFSGYIRAVKADIPFTVTAEDNMSLLKKNALSKSYENIELSALLSEIVPKPIKIKSAKIELGKLRINNATPAEVLNNLKTKYGIYSFFKNDELRSGIQYWGDGKNHVFDFNRNILPGYNLEFSIANDIKIKIKAISILDDNKRIEPGGTIGDEDGEIRTFHYYNIGKDELTRNAEEQLIKMKYDGYRGSFTTFGEPVVAHGDTVTLKDKNYPEREGTYVVKSVKRDFGQNGYRQTIEIDRLWI